MLSPDAAFRVQEQEGRFLHPEKEIESDINAIYQHGAIDVGLPKYARRLFDGIARDYTLAIVGVGLGDEGKGRIVDNKIEALLSLDGVQAITVIRYQGGSNAGHTVEHGNVKLALHQVPSGVLFPEVTGLMDRGMVIHPEDLRTEITQIEEKVGDTRGKLLLSQDATLVTDLERAEEILNRVRHGKAAGGTGRGIGPSYAHHYDRQGLKICDFMDNNWRTILSDHYRQYEKEFAAFGLEVAHGEVPDYAATLRTHKEEKRLVGTHEEFLDRMESVRTWLFERNMVTNTFLYHRDIYGDLQTGVLFEGAQAVGLHAWLGTYPDVTASDTSVEGIATGTAFWKLHNIQDRIGIFKITYTSSVGARHMPTEVRLPKDGASLSQNATADERWAAYVREEAHEFGTTTGRPRDILHLDLPMMIYNCRMAGIEILAGTHLDIAREGETIKVCTHYTNGEGDVVPYQPGLVYQEGVVPHYVELPGWDGEEARRARRFRDLPDNAKKFLAFIQRRTGYPIVAATTGPDREHLVKFQGYMPGN